MGLLKSPRFGVRGPAAKLHSSPWCVKVLPGCTWCAALVVLCGLLSACPATAQLTHAAAQGGVDYGRAQPLPSSRAAARRTQLPAGDFSHAPTSLAGSVQVAGGRRAGGQTSPKANAVVKSRSAQSDVFDNRDGTSTARLYSSPHNWKDAQGRWHQIDTALKAEGSRYVPTSAPVGVSVANPASATGPLVSAQVGAASLSLTPTFGTVRGGAIDKQDARYDVGATRVQLSVGATGWKDSITLTTAPATGSFAYRASLEGVTARNDADGVSFVMAGRVIVKAHDGIATDTAGASTKVTVRAVGDDIVTSVDLGWLRDPKRTYPVVIDPQYDIGLNLATGALDAFVSSAQPNTTFDGPAQVDNNAYVDKIGKCCSPTFNTTEYTSYLSFDTTAIDNRAIVHADWHSYFLTREGTYNQFNIYRVDQPWNPQTVTWNTKPNHSADVIHGTVPCSPNGTYYLCNSWVQYDMTSWVAGWANHSLPNDGVSLDTAGNNAYFRMAGDEYHGPSDPYIDVQYLNNPPNVPDRNTSLPADRSVRMSSTPTLSIAPGSDPDGDPLQYWFRIATEPDAETGQTVNSGWLSQPSFTVPEGVLRDGVTYYWKVFAWDRIGFSTPVYSSWPPVSLKINKRLGAPAVSPLDTAGPVSVNLANGNLFTSVAGPSMQTVGGSLGVTFDYNSQTQRPHLTGQYWNNCDRPPALDGIGAPTLVRDDSAIDFSWGTGSPAPGIIDPDNFCIRWTGFITAPTTGSYRFNAAHDDAIRIWVGGTLVRDDWTEDPQQSPDWGVESPVSLTAGVPSPIQVDYYEHTGGANVSLQYLQTAPNVGAPVPTDWLSTGATTLPSGWNMTAGAGTALAYSHTQIGADSVVLVAPDGETFEYHSNGSGSYTPPAGEDTVLTNGTETDGSHTYVAAAADGVTYTFDASGRLIRVTTATDPAHPASARYFYDVTSGLLSAIQDPVSGRQNTLSYGSTCAATSPYATAPAGMLCRINYWDGTTTELHYRSNGELGRIENPGNADTDFGYSNGLLVAERGVLANDAIAAGIRPMDGEAQTDITYDGNNHVQSVTLPAPTAGASRPSHTYTYTNSTTDLDIAGLSETSGHTRRVTLDSAGRTLTDTDPQGVTTTNTWNVGDTLATTERAGSKTTNVYDYADRLTDSYGPAADACFGTDNLPNGTCTTPAVAHTNTQYDGGLNGLGATFWNNDSFAGSPASVGYTAGPVNVAWGNGGPAGTSGDDFSARYTGYLTFPQSGTYQIEGCADDDIRVFIDNQLVVNRWGQPVGCTQGAFFVAANTTKAIRVEFHEITGDANFYVNWVKPDNTHELIPAQYLSPGYGLVTQTTADDTTAGSPPSLTQTQYDHPDLGLADRIIQDPAGQHLQTSNTYESGPPGYFRQLTKTLPAGTTTSYAYYGDTQVVANPCGTDSANQGGAVKSATAPVAADGSQRVEQSVYDAAGRVVASQVGTDPWTCMTYDARGRISSKTVPAFGTQPALTYSYNYAVANNPLTTSSSITNGGTVTSSVDLLGQVRSYTDTWGDTTTSTYDLAGRVTDQTIIGPNAVIVDTVHFGYDTSNRLASQQLDGKTVATVGYDAYSRISSAAYPSGSGNSGNGTTGGPFLYDSYGNVTDLPWANTTGSLTRDQVAYSQSGRVVDETIDGTDAYPAGNNFTYDTAGRLTNGRVADHSLTYNFAPTNGCGADPAAGENTNRTSMTNNGATTTYCYDNADRLTSSADATVGPITYDAHGNTITLGRQQMTYDGADQHLTTQLGTTVQVAYTRDATGRIIQRTEVDPATIGQRAPSTAATTTTNTINIPKPVAVVTGDRLIVQLTIHGTATATPPAGWTQLDNRVSATSVRHVVLTKIAGSAEPANYTVTFSAPTSASAGLAAYTNVATVTLRAAKVGNSATIPLSANVPKDASRILALYGTNGTPTLTAPAGMALRFRRASTTTATAQADATQPLAGATGTKTATLSASTNWVGDLLVLQPTKTVAAERYGFTSNGDSPDLTLSFGNAIIERTFGLPGGAALTKRSNTDPTLDRWSYPDIHGDITATTDGNGKKLGATFKYDPYGNDLTTAIPDNSNGNYDNGWLGQHQRGLEHAGTSTVGTLATIEMGARQYVPLVGRFLEVDPVAGGSANDYDYVHGDPVNGFDLAGTWHLGCGWCHHAARAVRHTIHAATRFVRAHYDIIATGLALGACGAGAVVTFGAAAAICLGASVSALAARSARTIQRVGWRCGSRSIAGDAIFTSASLGFGAAADAAGGSIAAKVARMQYFAADSGAAAVGSAGC
jgi:RHS repeat-associated protein